MQTKNLFPLPGPEHWLPADSAPSPSLLLLGKDLSIEAEHLREWQVSATNTVQCLQVSGESSTNLPELASPSSAQTRSIGTCSRGRAYSLPPQTQGTSTSNTSLQWLLGPLLQAVWGPLPLGSMLWRLPLPMNVGQIQGHTSDN